MSEFLLKNKPKMIFIDEFFIFYASSGCSGRGGDVGYKVLVIINTLMTMIM